jgi:mono/diheme cytochrome c family protein
MKLLLSALLLALSCSGQSVVKQGEQVFAKSCATGYCHGVRGVSSGAPRLAGRGFNQAYINNVVMRGIPGTGMPSSAMLSKPDLAAVVAYVATLNGITNPDLGSAGSAATSTGPVLSSESARGAKLFSEAVRGFGRCSTCHEIAGFGTSVAAPIEHVPASVSAFKALATPNVKTGATGEESMPVLVLSEGKQSVLFYDLTSTPPVQRNTDPGTVKFSDGSSWRHASAVGAYNDAELAAILAYLRAALK